MLFSPQGHLHHLLIQAAMSGFVLAILFAPKLEEGLDRGGLQLDGSRLMFDRQNSVAEGSRIRPE